MTHTARLPDPEALFWRFTDHEPDLRREYLRVGTTPPRKAEPPPELLVKTSATLLEVLAVADCLFELLPEAGLETETAKQNSPAFFRDRVRQLCGLDMFAVVSEAQQTFGDIVTEGAEEIDLSIPLLVRVTRSIIEACPIASLEQIAADHGLEHWGNRCRVAYAALRGFVLRNDDQQSPRIQLLGRQFVRGELSPQDIATILDVHVVDALALLESYGFNRPLDAITLDPTQRTALLERIRTDRLQRKGSQVVEKDAIARDVIASERIEGIDARQWIQGQHH